ncbi:MAG: nicotinate phosphoribosyltransferase, partial [Desulfobacteraceae bacterium]|nr:nicotinate phosphoribosyltransferase [Desulfobacteraceae bacterium]
MIESILDNDLYKFTMQQAVLRRYPRAEAEYGFTDRGNTFFPPGMAGQLRSRIDAMAALALTPAQRDWLAQACPYFETGYLEYLSGYRFDPAQVRLEQTGPSLSLTVKGPWHHTILWEVPLLALISEIYFAMKARPVLSRVKIREKNRAKAEILARSGVNFVDFGTRRRFSYQNHEHLMADILSTAGHTLTGTSNVHMARKWGIPPIGTMAHEWIMFHAAPGGYEHANELALDAWKSVYPDVLGIALTDTYTTGKFLKIFNASRAAQWAGVRQDSGDPCGFVQKLVSHYRSLGIDPKTKTIVFSDGLTVDTAAAIHRACCNEVNDTYGIGTH